MGSDLHDARHAGTDRLNVARGDGGVRRSGQLASIVEKFASR